MDPVGAVSSNNLTSQKADLTFRRSKRFKTKALPYWDFERIACISTTEGNQTVVARDIPGEGTIIIEKQLPSIEAESSLTKLSYLHKTKPSKRIQPLQNEVTESIDPAVQQSKQSSMSTTSLSSTLETTKKTGTSVSFKEQTLYSLDSNLEEQPHDVREECHIPVLQSEPSSMSTTTLSSTSGIPILKRMTVSLQKLKSYSLSSNLKEHPHAVSVEYHIPGEKVASPVGVSFKMNKNKPPMEHYQQSNKGKENTNSTHENISSKKHGRPCKETTNASTSLYESSPTKFNHVHKTKSSMRKQPSQNEVTESIHPAELQSEQSSMSTTTLSSTSGTPKTTGMSVSAKKQRLFSLASILKEQPLPVNEECHSPEDEVASPVRVPFKMNTNKPPVKHSEQSNKGKEKTLSAQKKTKSKRPVRPPGNKNSLTSSSSGSKVNTSKSDSTGGTKDANKPKDAAPPADHPPSQDHQGYSTCCDSFSSSVMCGENLKFSKVMGTVDDTSPTGDFHVAQGVVHGGISVFFLHLTKGYIAFKTPMNMTFIGMTGEGHLTLVDGSMPSMRTTLRPDTEVHTDKGAVVAIACKENCSNLAVCMVTIADNDTEGITPSKME